MDAKLLRVRDLEKVTGIEAWRWYELFVAGQGPDHIRIGRTIRGGVGPGALDRRAGGSDPERGGTAVSTNSPCRSCSAWEERTGGSVFWVRGGADYDHDRFTSLVASSGLGALRA